MMTPVNIDESLLQEALELDREQSIEIVMQTALSEYIQRRKRMKITELFGTIDYEEINN